MRPISNFWNKGVIAVGVDADFVRVGSEPAESRAREGERTKILQVYVAGVKA
jgi:alpha-D-ribose 1-methylphosphonate 5-triphosphate diphosphatase PhnM